MPTMDTWCAVCCVYDCDGACERHEADDPVYPTFSGWKVFTYLDHNNDGVVMECVTDDRQPARMVFRFSADEAVEIAASLAEQAARSGSRGHEGEHCQVCGEPYDDVYCLPGDLWALVTPKPEQPGAGLLCPSCVVQRLSVEATPIGSCGDGSE